MQQNNTMIIVLHFDEIWKQKKQTAFFIIQSFEIFKKDLQKHFQKQNDSKNI